MAFLTQEWAEGADLNGDGDFFDEVAQLVDVTSGVVRNTGLAATNEVVAALRDPPSRAPGARGRQESAHGRGVSSPRSPSYR